MTIIGKSRPVRAAALRLSSANRRSSPDTSPAGTECLDIFSPPPGDSDVISQVLRDSSSETKIAPSAVRMAAGAGRGASSGIVASRGGWGCNLTVKEQRSLVGRPWDLSTRLSRFPPRDRGRLSDQGPAAFVGISARVLPRIRAFVGYPNGASRVG